MAFHNMRVLGICMLALLFVGGPAYGTGQFGPESDISGLTLSMGQDQIKKFVKTNYKGRPFALMPVKIATNDYRKDIILGLLLHVKPHQDDNSMERIRVFFNPDTKSKDIFAIYRYVDYGINSRVTMATLIDSLVEKYGQPTSVQGVNYTWSTSGASYNQKTFPHFVNNWHGNGGSLQDEIDYITKNDFMGYFFNNVNPRTEFRGNSGLILNIQISPKLGAPAYVSNITETLIDLNKSVSELTSFKSDFYAKDSQAINERISHDMKNRPGL